MIIISWHSPFSDCNTRTSVSKCFLRCTIKIMSFCAVIRLTRQPDNINAVPFASSMPEVVSISKYWKSNLEFYCSKTAFLSQSQPVNLQTIFHISVVRICKIQSWMYFCCQSEGRLYWPQVCRISFATRSVPKWKWRVTSRQESSKKVHLSAGKPQKVFTEKHTIISKLTLRRMIWFANSNNFLANDCDTTQTARSQSSIKKLLKKIIRAASLLVTNLKTSLGEG